MPKRATRSLLIIVLHLLAACSQPKPPQVPKPEAISTPPLRLIADALGALAFEAALAARHELSGRDEDKREAAKVLTRLTAAEAIAPQWNVHIIDSDDADATAFPGGGFLISRGLLDCPADRLLPAPKRKSKGPCQLSAKEQKKVPLERVLGPVLSHELSHVTGQHFLRRLQANAAFVLQAATEQLMRAGVSHPQALKDPRAMLAVLRDMKLEQRALVALLEAAGVTVAGETIGHPFMLEQESEADCESVRLMNAAHYDPRDALKFWTVNPSGKSTLLRSHPSPPERRRKLEACIKQGAPQLVAGRS